MFVGANKVPRSSGANKVLSHKPYVQILLVFPEITVNAWLTAFAFSFRQQFPLPLATRYAFPPPDKSPILSDHAECHKRRAIIFQITAVGAKSAACCQ